MAIAYEIEKAGQAVLDQIHSTFSALSDLKNSSDQLLANKTVYSNTYSTGNYTTFSQHLYSGGRMTYTIGSEYPEIITIHCTTGSGNGDIVFKLQDQYANAVKWETIASTYYELYKPYKLTAELRFSGSQSFTISRERLY
jgi:hypothetical protein